MILHVKPIQDFIGFVILQQFIGFVILQLAGKLFIKLKNILPLAIGGGAMGLLILTTIFLCCFSRKVKKKTTNTVRSK